MTPPTTLRNWIVKTFENVTFYKIFATQLSNRAAGS